MASSSAAHIQYKHTNKHTHFLQKAAGPTGGACKSHSLMGCTGGNG